MNLRQLAKDRACEIRVPNHCLRSNETVVGCHYRLSTFSGMGKKSEDWLLAYGCFACHQIVDGQRNSEFSLVERKLMLAEGVFRTQRILFAEGVLRVGRTALHEREPPHCKSCACELQTEAERVT